MSEHANNSAFAESGWILLKALVSPQELALLIPWADGLERRDDACLRYYEVLQDGQRVLSRVEKFFELDSPVGHLLRPGSKLMVMISALFQDQPVLFKDKINLKPAGGGAYTIHQDAPAYAGFGVSDFLTAMIALDKATVENGCLEFAMGPRVKRELELDNQGQISGSEINGMQFQPVPMERGDVIVFDGLVPHKSSANCSDSARRALFLTFNRNREGDKRAEYYRAKCQLFPPETQRQPGRDYRKLGRQFNLGNPFV